MKEEKGIVYDVDLTAADLKTLAEQSNSSANDIKIIVADIIEQSEKSVSLAAEVANIISVEQGYISDTQMKFKTLSGEIQLSLDEIDRIAVLTKELNEYKIGDKKVLVSVKDPMLLYKHKINLRKLFKQNKNLEENLKKYKIIIRDSIKTQK